MTDEHQEVAPEVEATDQVAAEAAPHDPDGTPEATPETPEASEATPAEDEAEKKAKSRHQRRREQMDRLQSELEEKDKLLKEAEARVQEIEANSSTVPPKEDDYGTFEEYQAALSAHHAMRMMDDRQKAEVNRQAEAHRAERQRIEQERQREVAQSWASQLEDATVRYADFKDVALNPAVPITPQIATMLASMDAGADVAYHLGMNVADAQRLAELPPIEAAIELGRIEARLSVPHAKKVTSAPDPVNPVRGSATVDKDWTKMSPDEFDEWRAAGGVPA